MTSTRSLVVARHAAPEVAQTSVCASVARAKTNLRSPIIAPLSFLAQRRICFSLVLGSIDAEPACGEQARNLS